MVVKLIHSGRLSLLLPLTLHRNDDFGCCHVIPIGHHSISSLRAFEEAKEYEKKAEDDKGNGTFYWLGKDTPLSTLEDPKRIASIKAEHDKKRERFLKRKRINVLQVDVTDIDRDFMDEIYDEQEGGGACVTCYK